MIGPLVTGSPSCYVNVRPNESELPAGINLTLTGSEPGDHGLVVMPTGELRLFEFRGGEVPRVIHAAYRPARAGGTPALVTDQPGGVALVRDADTVLYSGETYTRVR